MKLILSILVFLAALFGINAFEKPLYAADQTAGSDMVPAETKDADIPSGKYKDMYCVKNNAILFPNIPADKTPAFYNPEAGDGKNAPEQVMKYDRVRMYEVKDGWARVVLTTKPQSAQSRTLSLSKGGWVLRSALADWDSSKFLKVKDNVFTAKSPALIYDTPYSPKDNFDNPLSQNSIETVTSNEKYRVLKGNGERFLVVSDSGKTGWMNVQNIETKELVAKSVQIEKFISVEVPSTTKYSNQTKFKENDYIKFFVPNGYSVDPNLSRGNIDETLLIGKLKYKTPEASKLFPNTRKDKTLLRKNGKVVVLEDLLGYNFNYIRKIYKDIPVITNINSIQYALFRYPVINFYGMIAVFEVFKPAGLIDLEKKIFDSEQYGTDYRYYMNQINNIVVKNNWVQKTRITLYSYDTSLNKIKEVWIDGNFHVEAGLEHLYDNPNNRVVFSEKEAKITVGTVKNVVLIVPYINDYNGPVWEGYLTGEVPGYNINIDIKKEEFEKAGMTIIDAYNNWNAFAKVKDLKGKSGIVNNNVFKNKPLVIDGKRYDFENGVSDQYYFLFSPGREHNVYLNNNNISVINGYYVLKGEERGLIVLVNKLNNIINVVTFKNALATQVIGINNESVIINATLTNGSTYLKSINGVICEY